MAQMDAASTAIMNLFRIIQLGNLRFRGKVNEKD